MSQQIQLSSRKGGLGLREPKSYQFAAKLSAFIGKAENVGKFFPFLTENRQINNNNINDININNSMKWYQENDIESMNEIHRKSIEKYNDYTQHCENKFNDTIAPNYVYSPQLHQSHRDLIEIIDKSTLTKMYNIGTKYDHARMKSIQTNGALSWLNVPYNTLYSIEFDNTDYSMCLNYILGAKLDINEIVRCHRCNKEMDPFGTHATTCPYGGLTILRHNRICDKLMEILKQAGYECKREEKYKEDENGNFTELKGVPGDIEVLNYPVNGEYKTVYFDITVGNPCSKSYIHETSKTRCWLNDFNEKRKMKKYGNKANIFGLSFETYGAISYNVKSVLKHLANKISIQKQTVHENTLMHRMRSQMVAVLMHANAQMMKKSFN